MTPRTDWKALAAARGLKIPAADLEAATRRLDALEETFRPLAQALTPDQEPAVAFRADAEAE